MTSQPDGGETIAAIERLTGELTAWQRAILETVMAANSAAEAGAKMRFALYTGRRNGRAALHRFEVTQAAVRGDHVHVHGTDGTWCVTAHYPVGLVWVRLDARPVFDSDQGQPNVIYNEVQRFRVHDQAGRVLQVRSWDRPPEPERAGPVPAVYVPGEADPWDQPVQAPGPEPGDDAAHWPG